MTISKNLVQILSTLPDGVALVAVSKYHSAEDIMEAYDAGQRVFGESRAQEMAAKYDILPKDIRWHFIGHLQTNKVRLIAPFVELIHSVDSVRIAEQISKEALLAGRTIDIMLEVHLARETTKQGFDPAELRAALPTLQKLDGIKIVGLMAMATNTNDKALINNEFATAHALQQELGLRELSIGMSDDYHIALENSSTYVRVGSSIFGVSNY